MPVEHKPYINVYQHGGEDIVGYLHFQSAEGAPEMINLQPANNPLPIRHNADVFGDLRQPHIGNVVLMPINDGEDARNIILTDKAEKCIHLLNELWGDRAADLERAIITKKVKLTRALKDTIKNYNKDDINQIYSTLLNVYTKDSVQLRTFETIQDSVIESQTEVFNANQWNFDKSVDINSKAQTLLVTESGSALALMSALFLALRFSESKEVSGSIAATGLAVCLGQLANICMSGYKISGSDMNNIKSTAKILDAQNVFRETSVFIERGAVKTRDINSNNNDEIEASLKDNKLKFKVNELSSKKCWVTARMFGLGVINLAVIGVWVFTFIDKLASHDNKPKTGPETAQGPSSGPAPGP